MSVHEALDDAARILDESIAQPRPRYFAFIGSSGLEIGTIGDLLAHTYDINLAVDARAATEIENQAVRWVSEFVGFPAAIGAFTSGGTISNVTALAAAREPRCPVRASAGYRGGVRRSTAPPRSTTRSRARWSCSASGRTTSARCRSTRRAGCGRMPWPRRSTRCGRGRHAGGRRGDGGHHAHGRDRSDRAIAECARNEACGSTSTALGLPAAGAARALFPGLERADSVSVDAHKWLYLPKACGVVLVPSARRCARVRARGGVPAPPAARVARRRHHARVLPAVPGLKLWLAFRAHGAPQFRDAIAQNLHEATLLYRAASARRTSRHGRAAAALDRAIRHTPAASRISTRTTRRSRRRSRPTGASTSHPR